MQMQGILQTAEQDEPPRPTGRKRAAGWLRRNRVFMLLVILPTAIAALYYGVIASDQYETNAEFLVRTSLEQPSSPQGFGAVLNLTGTLTQSQSEALSIVDFLLSHQAVEELDKRAGLTRSFTGSDIDFVSRLDKDPLTPEDMLEYYRDQVDVVYNSDTGLTSIKARAFEPDDSYRIVKAMLDLGEERVNVLNDRAYTDAIEASERQLQQAETALAQAQSGLAEFRRTNGDINPEGTGEAQIELVSGLSESVSQAQARLDGMRGLILPNAPQFVAQAAHVRALRGQLEVQRSELAGSGRTIASSLGRYQDLELQRELAAKRYEVAFSEVTRAREKAVKQQLYVVRVVDPNLPVKSEYPKRWRNLAIIFFGLLGTFAIGWLVVAGVREHEA